MTMLPILRFSVFFSILNVSLADVSREMWVWQFISIASADIQPAEASEELTWVRCESPSISEYGHRQQLANLARVRGRKSLLLNAYFGKRISTTSRAKEGTS